MPAANANTKGGVLERHLPHRRFYEWDVIGTNRFVRSRSTYLHFPTFYGKISKNPFIFQYFTMRILENQGNEIYKVHT